MTATAWTPDDWHAILHDPVRDKGHLSTAIGNHLIAYLEWAETEARKRPRTIDSYERCLARGARMFPALPAAQWTKDHIRAVIASFPDGSRPKVWAAHSDFWKWMWEEERTEATPMRGVRRPKPPPRRIPEIFETTERQRLIAAASRSLLPRSDKARILILLDVGLRKGEAAALQVKDVNTADRVLIVRDAKGGDERVMGYGDELQRALNALLFSRYPILDREPGPDDYLFFPSGANARGLTWLDPSKPMVSSTFQRWWDRLVKRADVRYRKMHTTRHTYGTEMQEATGDVEAVKEALGHKSLATTELYVHAARTRMNRSVSALEEYRRGRSAPPDAETA